MADQLWTSRITGYRRRGTRLSELRSLLEAGITAGAIFEPLQSCPASAEAREMADMLTSRDFDVAGVQSTPDGPVLGFVRRDALGGGLVQDHLTPLVAEHLVSEAIPLGALLNVLKDRPHSFVLIGAEVQGIVTRADLNKPPVRVYLFGLVSLLEMHLSFWIEDRFRGDSWQVRLRESRLDLARRLQARRRERNQDPGLFECLQFCDRRDIVLGCDELREKMQLGAARDAKACLEAAGDLRDILAHSQRYLDEGSSWDAVIGLVGRIEEIVHASDETIAREAAVARSRGQAGLRAET